MKIRQGFVSNSSSSSFCIPLSEITGLQLQMIIKHSEIAGTLGGYDDDCPWNVDIVGGEVHCHTDMDNFDMEHFLTCVVGIPNDIIKRGDY